MVCETDASESLPKAIIAGLSVNDVIWNMNLAHWSQAWNHKNEVDRPDQGDLARICLTTLKSETTKLLGKQDFCRFGTHCEHPDKDTERTMYSIAVDEVGVGEVLTQLIHLKHGSENKENGTMSSSGISHMKENVLVLTFVANGFMRHMVRRLVGFLLAESLFVDGECNGSLKKTWFLNRIFGFKEAGQVIDADDNVVKPKKAPPSGLWLWGDVGNKEP